MLCLPWPMGCTMPHPPMGHGLYNTFSLHGLWVVQHIASHSPWVVQYSASHGSWVVQHSTSHGPWVVQHLPRLLISHGSWVVQLSLPPWPMDCTTLYLPWVMGCTTLRLPWPMGCTMPHLSMGHGLYSASSGYWFPMTHGLYNAPPIQVLINRKFPFLEKKIDSWNVQISSS
jgi:hypothetical protein